MTNTWMVGWEGIVVGYSLVEDCHTEEEALAKAFRGEDFDFDWDRKQLPYIWKATSAWIEED